MDFEHETEGEARKLSDRRRYEPPKLVNLGILSDTEGKTVTPFPEAGTGVGPS